MKLFEKKKKAETGVAPTQTKRRVKRKPIIITMVLLIICAGAAIGAKALFFTESDTKTALTETTSYGSLGTTIEGTGTTVPAESLTVTTASSATIESVFVSAGDTVAVGDPLYTQDDSELDTQIEEYEDSIAELQDQLTSYADQISDLKETLSELTVSAPFSGRLIEVEAKEGDSVQKGSKLAVLVDDSAMTLTQYFSYTYEDQIYLGMSASISVAELMTNLTGTVTDIQKVERLTTEGDRCFAVTVTVDNPGALTEGMTGAGYLISGEESIYPSIEGTIEYLDSKTLTAEAAGELSAVKVVAYQTVTSGEALFVVDGSDYQEQVESLNKKVTQTQARVESYNDKIAETEEKRSDYTVTATIAGKVIMVGVKAGEKPRQAGMTAVSIYNMDSMAITANIDELDIDRIAMGMEVTVTQSGSEKDTVYTGTVTEISYEATNTSGVAYFPITIEIPSEGALSAGVNVSYTIAVGDAEEGVLVPIAALKKTGDGTYVFVKSDLRPDNAVDLEDVDVPEGFYAVPVEVGVTGSRYARVLSGVEQDTEVFTRYQQSAPANGDSTSEGQGEAEQAFPNGEMGNGSWNGGERPDFAGGGMGGMTPPG